MIFLILLDLLIWQIVAIKFNFMFIQAIPNILYLVVFTKQRSPKDLINIRLIMDMYLTSILVFNYPAFSYVIAPLNMLGLMTNVCYLQRKWLNHVLIIYSTFYAFYFIFTEENILLISVTFSCGLIYVFANKYLHYTLTNHEELRHQVMKYIKTIVNNKDIQYKYAYPANVNLFISYCREEGYEIVTKAFCPQVRCKMTEEIRFLLEALDIKYDYYNHTITINNLDQGINYEKI